ncbi:MAG: heparan-alpha-glucosaminide N-acetyltransferase domain-containing protein [Bryobacteraceae bacterium]|nr:heparan-alpha-glucosaminide N-acetyltransferase domain-containing protein [Bryobacteraceae bacterium]
MSSNTRTGGQRLAFLDWTRGLAALIMLQGHVFHSFTAKELRNDGPYVLSQFIGGITPAVFLFLTGVTLAFLMDSASRKGLSPWQRTWAAARRSGYLLLLAVLFRLQMWSFSLGKSPWTDLFKVDILNCMGLGIIALSPLAIFSTRDRIRFGVITGLFIAGAAPFIRMADWSWLHPFARAWFVPDPNFFAFFPWAAFIAFGLAAGSLLRVVEPGAMGRMMEWWALFGLILVVGAHYFANLPYSIYPQSDFWVDSPALILIKTGIILMIASFAWLWTTYVNTGWSPLRQLGTTSLLVYWVHTELVYGSWFWRWKEALTVPQTLAAAAFIILLMLGLSIARTGWKGGPSVPALLRQRWIAWREQPLPQAGD